MNLFAVSITTALMVFEVSGMGSKSTVEKIESENRKILPSSQASSLPPVTAAPINLIENSSGGNKAIEEQVRKFPLKRSESATAKTKAAAIKKAKKQEKRSVPSKKTNIRVGKKIRKNKSKK